MALTNYASFSPNALAIVDFVVTGNVVASGVIGASEAASVEGTTVDIVGMTFVEVVALLVCFNWINLSNSFFVSLS